MRCAVSVGTKDSWAPPQVIELVVTTDMSYALRAGDRRSLSANVQVYHDSHRHPCRMFGRWERDSGKHWCSTSVPSTSLWAYHEHLVHQHHYKHHYKHHFEHPSPRRHGGFRWWCASSRHSAI